MVEQVGQRLGQVVRLDRAARARRRSGCRPWTSSPSRGSRARPWRRSGCRPWRGCRRRWRRCRRRRSAVRLGRQPVEPLAGGHRLAGRRVVAEAAPVALVLDLLVGDRALDDQHERLELAAVGLEEPLEEVVGAAVGAALEVDQRPVHGDLRQPGQGAEGDLLDAGLGGRGEGHGVAVAAEAGVDPQHVDQGLFGGACCLASRRVRHVATLPGVSARPARGSTPDIRWDRISVYLCGDDCDYAHIRGRVKAVGVPSDGRRRAGQRASHTTPPCPRRSSPTGAGPGRRVAPTGSAPPAARARRRRRAAGRSC